MTKSQDTLSRLTLRQLRYKASDLGVTLYSRKSKALLIKEITSYVNKIKTKKLWSNKIIGMLINYFNEMDILK